MSAPSGWIVRKFGGSSLAGAACLQRVAALLVAPLEFRQVIVVSAARGVTDELLDLMSCAERQDAGVAARLAALIERHRRTAEALDLPAELRVAFDAALTRDARDIADILHTTQLVRSGSRSARELVAGFGELWSCQLLSGLLSRQIGARGVQTIDARDVLAVRGGELGPVVLWERSRTALLQALTGSGATHVVIPGFIASDERGVQTTLGRNGSDYSASIFAALLDAERIEIWTDVDGVMSADPRLVPDARIVGTLSYQEAVELAYFGARVIHPQTMAPAIEHQIPIYIRNTFDPQAPGTLISARANGDLLVKGITSIDRVALLNLEGTGMIGVPGTAHRLFGALREAGVSVVLISQASSEHSICFAVPQSDVEQAERAVRQAFDAELRQGQIQKLGLAHDLSILAVVGDRMAGTPGMAARVFGALGTAGVNVRAIAQGSSERNISAVIDGRETARALRAVHSGLYLSPQTLSIGLIGPGTVGATLLAQLAPQLERLRSERRLDLRLRGVTTSKRMLLAPRELSAVDWRNALERDGTPADLEQFVEHIQADHLPHAVLIDCTASAAIAERYADWIGRGIHVITPNKKANSSAWPYYRRLRELRRAQQMHYLYETTVGAGLPIIQTLRDLVETGDEILAIEGIFSGTLAYLFNLFDGERPFSAIVRDARERGYTEPDPRDDLSGMDVARKVVILGRELGQALELADLDVESLVPEALRGIPLAAFLERLAENDTQMSARLAAARAEDRVLRYVGRLGADGSVRVGLESLAQDHPFAHINLTDNVVRFVTRRYHDNPLIVQGPGAGPDVTAAGVFADLLRLGTYLGASA